MNHFVALLTFSHASHCLNVRQTKGLDQWSPKKRVIFPETSSRQRPCPPTLTDPGLFLAPTLAASSTTLTSLILPTFHPPLPASWLLALSHGSTPPPPLQPHSGFSSASAFPLFPATDSLHIHLNSRSHSLAKAHVVFYLILHAFHFGCRRGKSISNTSILAVWSVGHSSVNVFYVTNPVFLQQGILLRMVMMW